MCGWLFAFEGNIEIVADSSDSHAEGSTITDMKNVERVAEFLKIDTPEIIVTVLTTRIMQTGYLPRRPPFRMMHHAHFLDHCCTHNCFSFLSPCYKVSLHLWCPEQQGVACASQPNYNRTLTSHVCTHTHAHTCTVWVAVWVRHDLIMKPLTVSQAEDMRDTMAKSMFENIFSWQVTGPATTHRTPLLANHFWRSTRTHFALSAAHPTYSTCRHHAGGGYEYCHVCETTTIKERQKNGPCLRVQY